MFRAAAAATTLAALLLAAGARASSAQVLQVSATVVRSVAVSVEVGPSSQPVVSVRTAGGSTWTAPVAAAPSGTAAAPRAGAAGEPDYLVVTVLADGPTR